VTKNNPVMHYSKISTYFSHIRFYFETKSRDLQSTAHTRATYGKLLELPVEHTPQ